MYMPCHHNYLFQSNSDYRNNKILNRKRKMTISDFHANRNLCNIDNKHKNKCIWWIFSYTPISSLNKSECHDAAEILLIVVLDTNSNPSKHVL